MSLATTKLDSWALDYEGSGLDEKEHRLGEYGAYEAFKADTPNLVPRWSEFVGGRKSADRTVRIPVIKKEAFSTSSSRSCSAKTAVTDSAFVTPSWTTIETGFQQNPAIYADNYIGMMSDFAVKMKNLQRVFLEAVDTAGYTHLNANKSAVNNADGNPYTVAANFMQVPAADNELFFNEISSIMTANDHTGGELNHVCSPRVRALVSKLTAQGAGNSDNRIFQFTGDSFGYSRRVSVATGMRDTVFSMPPGSLAYLWWIDIDARADHVSGDGKEWFVQDLPLLGHDVGVLFQSTCGDKSSSLTGLEATLVESYMFSFDYTFFSAYNSDTAALPGSIYGSQFSKT